MSEALIIQLAAIIVPCFFGASGIVALVIYFYKNHKAYLNELRDAFLMEKNDKESRLDALMEYRKKGGTNFKNYENVITESETVRKGGNLNA